MNISRYIDYTLLAPEATKEDIIKLCEKAKQHNYKTVCVQPSRVDLAYKYLAGSNTGVTTVVGFPNGASYFGYDFGINSIVQEVKNILFMHHTCEIDMVMDIGALKDGDYSTVLNGITKVKRVVDKSKYSKLKVIIETGALTNEEKRTATKIVCDCGADFVKTSTGMNKCSKPATVEDIQLMYEIVNGTKTLIKASSGIKDYETALALLKAGASRLGTSSLICGE
jgi:deoxyribose-phosphate aldolase